MPDPISQTEKVGYLEVIAKTILAEEPDDARFKRLLEQFRDVVGKVVSNPKKRDVDSLFSDLSEMCRHSPIEMRKTISAELQRRLGRPLSYFEKARLARIDRIVARGKVRTDDEWRLIEERVQELCEEETVAQCEVLNRLLAEYKPKAEA